MPEDIELNSNNRSGLKVRLSMKTCKRFLAYKFCTLITKLPKWVRNPWLYFLARIAWWVDKRSQRHAVKNLQFAFPDKRKDWINKLAKRSYILSVLNAADILWLDSISPTIHNKEVLQTALDAGKGVCLLTLHLGSWETIAIALKKQGFPIKMLTNIPKSFDLLHQCYEQAGIPYICRGEKSCLLQLMQGLQKNHIVCFFSDQFGDESPVTFFGQSTMAPSGGVTLASMLGAKIVIGWSWKDTTGQYNASFESFDMIKFADRQQQIQHNMQRVMERFEQLIYQYPDQWLWSYNRFKRSKKKSRLGLVNEE